MTLDGKLWFLAMNVADAIGAQRNSMSANLRASLAEDEVRTLLKSEMNYEIQSLFPARGGRLIAMSESGLYKYTLRAHAVRPKAVAFQGWVTRVVLPTVRKEGSYFAGEEKVATGEISRAENIYRSSSGSGTIPFFSDLRGFSLRKLNSPSSRGTAMITQSTAAADSFTTAADFLEHAAQLLTKGAPVDCPEVARWLDFARRKTWQGTEELGGRVFTFELD